MRPTVSLIVLVSMLLAPLSGQAATLVLATWNLEHLAEAPGAGCRPRAPADYDILRRVAERLDADIIALQEVENAQAVARVFDPARYDIILSPRPTPRLQDCRGMSGQQRTAIRTGFAINRDKLAALGLAYRELPPERALGLDGDLRWGTALALRWSDAPSDGAIAVTSDAPSDASGEFLQLLSIHLKAGCAWGALEPFPIKRFQCRVLRRQLGHLEAWLDRQAEADQAIVVLGDFNRQLDQPRDHFWQEIDDAEVCRRRQDAERGTQCLPGTTRPDADADLRLANAGNPFPFARNPKYPYAVDHLVFGGAASDWLDAQSYRALSYGVEPAPSDHHPIRMALELPPGSPVQQ